ncbi:phosphoribosyltransferase-like protein [Geodermatophilus sp. SYSU D00691]
MPSQTTRGRDWLTNFADTERTPMALLLDSLQIVSPTAVNFGLKTQIESLAPELRRGGTGLLVPVLSLRDIDRALEQTRRRDEETEALPSPVEVPPSHRTHTAWGTYQPGMPISATPGSEGPVGNLVRDLTGERPGEEPSHWLHPASDVDALRDRKCRLLVLVTDYSGSGTQVTRFARTFVRNERIRSWRSFGWLKVVVVAYAMAMDARRACTASKYVDRITAAMPARSFEDADWTPSEQEEIRRICRHYVPRRQRRAALGFGGSAGLFLTHTSVPNNIPMVLRRQPPGWQPFLVGSDGRTVPQDLISELKDYRPPERNLVAVAEASDQLRLARAIESGRLRTPADRLVALLALVAHQTSDVPTVSHRLGRPEAEIQAMLAFLQHVGLVAEDLSVTARGRAELHHSRRLDRTATANLVGSDEPYYPHALR